MHRTQRQLPELPQCCEQTSRKTPTHPKSQLVTPTTTSIESESTPPDVTRFGTGLRIGEFWRRPKYGPLQALIVPRTDRTDLLPPPRAHAPYVHRGGSRGGGGGGGGSLGSNEPPLFTDSFDLLVLIVTPSVFDNHRLRASHVWLLYNLRLIARIDAAIGEFGEVSFLSIFLGVELASA